VTSLLSFYCAIQIIPFNQSIMLMNLQPMVGR
jgi:hypothetical protein